MPYPMSCSWLTGKMSEEAAKRNYGRWYEELTRSAGQGPESPASGKTGAS
jgi:hypothetical protein